MTETLKSFQHNFPLITVRNARGDTGERERKVQLSCKDILMKEGRKGVFREGFSKKFSVNKNDRIEK